MSATPQPGAPSAQPSTALPPLPSQAQAAATSTPHPPTSQMSNLMKAQRSGGSYLPSLPFLQGSNLLDFGRMDRNYTVLDYVVIIDNQNAVATATFYQLVQLAVVDLPLLLEDFIRMWKTLILRRVHDVYEMEKKRRPDHFVRLARNIQVPAPLGDFLYSLGQLRSPVDGATHDIIPSSSPIIVYLPRIYGPRKDYAHVTF
ncbi:hypothetical protein GE061_007986 [Apolygus lucorum]|uniref:Uncharacterized protein n=1 Tax=Apolygus lucorum TaxID=248454 RepID=A0A6A4IKJ1_APOLU|nr:hypothetical protein GE061_007986 [Apolygus lucorum]